MKTLLQRTAFWWTLGCISLLLIAKFIWPLFVFDVPMGYDPGVYRYLFLEHAKGLPPFVVTELAPWAKEHSLGVFMFTSPLIKLGLPVDWLIGWLWNIGTIALGGMFAYVASRRFGARTGVATLVAVLLSQAYFDGFAGMYIKAYVALFWWVCTLYCIDRKSWWAFVPGLLVLITHQQTGLLFLLCIGSGWLLWGKRDWRSRQWQVCTGLGALCALLGIIIYVPILSKALEQLPRLLGIGEGAGYGGAFPETSFFIKTTPLLLGLGIGGLLRYLWKERRLDQWSLPVLWSAIFVFGKLYFHNRFYLQFDFFLLPFAGYAIVQIWQRFSHIQGRILLITVLVFQLALSLHPVLYKRGPLIRPAHLDRIKEAATLVPDNAYVLVPDNHMPFWVRGWFTNAAVGGPGLLRLTWGEPQWTAFLFGAHGDRKVLLESLPQPTYIYVSDYFLGRYRENAHILVNDSCLKATSHKQLYLSVCQTMDSE